MEQQPLLVAETNDDGRIDWLWHAQLGMQARPVRDAAACLRELNKFAVYGASKPDVEEWLRCHPVQSR